MTYVDDKLAEEIATAVRARVSEVYAAYGEDAGSDAANQQACEAADEVRASYGVIKVGGRYVWEAGREPE
jgi:hypothetical protein